MKLSLLLSLSILSTSGAAPQLELIAKDLKMPVWATSTASKQNYLYILEKAGVIQILNLNTGKILDKPFLDIRDRIKILMNEQGLLGMAFDPNFEKNGRFYINYTNLKGDTQIARFHCDPATATTADASSEHILISIDQPYRNHNGGWVGFGPDHFLYISTGDGGAGNDPKNYAQNMQSLLGKLLRIDVSADKSYSIPPNNPYVNDDTIKSEIYAHGLRNPWRCDWDVETNHLFIADVGQNKEEEINYISAENLSGADFGWRLREGAASTPKKKIGGKPTASQTEPLYTYEHGAGKTEGLSITGGFIYQGSIEALKGHYIFADWINPRLWSFQVEDNKPVHFTDWTDQFKLKENKINRISSFGKDAHGELYLMEHQQGTLFKIVDK